MSVLIKIRNQDDVTETYDTIEIQSGSQNLVSAMSNLKTDLAISTSYVTDYSPGYTSYTDTTGTIGTTYYRYRFKKTSTSVYSPYSVIFPAGYDPIITIFRNKMSDINAADYFFQDSDIYEFERLAVASLFPMTWDETYTDTMIVPDGTTKVFPFSSGVTRVSELYFLDSSGNFSGKVNAWSVSGKNIIFDFAPSSGNTIRAFVEKRFTEICQVPMTWDDYILTKMRLQAYEAFESDRSKYYKYNSVVKPDGGGLPSIDKIISRLENQLVVRSQQIRRVRKPADIKLV